MKNKLRSLFGRLASLFRRRSAGDRSGESRTGRKEKAKKEKPKFRLLRNFWILVILIPLALIFTQALINPVSTVVFVFLLIMPFISLIYILLAVPAVKVYLDSDTTEVEKLSEVSFSLAISNESPLPFPFVEAEITVPGAGGVRSESELTMLSLIPFGSYVIENKTTFKYRGQYDIGVSDVYVYDFFRFFCFRIELNLFRQIFVMPRRLIMPGGSGNEATIENTESVIRRIGTDNTETSDIRAYIQGDSLRSIHWKLSEKTQDLMVRQYSQNSERQTYIFCDTARRYPADPEKFEEDINEYSVDGVVEAAIAIARDSLQRANNSVSVVWFDSRMKGDVCSLRMNGMHDFEESYRLFASCPVTETAEPLAVLTSMIPSSEANNISLVFVTGRADKAFASALSGVASVGAAGTEAYIYNPSEKIAENYRPAFFDEVEFCTTELMKNGISVRSAHFDVMPGAASHPSEKEAGGR